MLLLGSMFVLIGVTILQTRDEMTGSPFARRAYEAHLDLMPLGVWGSLFIACGAVALGSAFIRQHTWWGFTALMAVSSLWGLEFVASWMQNGYGRAWLGALQWAIVVGVLLIIVGWEDPPARRPGEFR